MTSNLGSEFAFQPDKELKEKSYNEVVKRTFKPEFVNRIDDIIIFNPLSQDVLEGIVDKFIDLLAKRLEDRNIKLELTSAAKNRIIEEGSDITYGARPIKRYIQQNIETVLAYKIIEDSIDGNTTLTILINLLDFLLNNVAIIIANEEIITIMNSNVVGK